MSPPQGGFRGRRERAGGEARGRVLLRGALALVVVLAWSWTVLAWGGEGGRSQGAGGEAGGEARSEARGEVGEIPRAPAGRPAAGAEGTGAVPDEPAYATTPAPAAGDPGRKPGARGGAGEPGSYDPLGTGAEPGDLTPTDERRVRYAAQKFVMAAYGYTGGDGAEYLAGVASVSLSPDLSLSKGGPEISRYQRQVETTGTRSAVRLIRFEVEGSTPDTAEGYAYFETGEGYGRDGELSGKRLAYRQRMTLSRVGASWKVKEAGKVEEV